MLTLVNGDKYDGVFSQGKRAGEFTVTYHNKNVYKGMLVDNKKHGRGKIITATGVEFQVEYNMGEEITPS